jgi:isopenicillin-N epimerase
MLDALHQRRARDGIVLRVLDPPVPALSMGALEQLYAEAMGPTTRLVLLTHPSNRTGQLLPVRQIAERAHAVGAEVVVDGAQSLGVLEDPVRSLNCDYYGASAHKWMGTPVGLGVLWMRPELAEKVWPVIPPPASAKGVKKFEWVGTAPLYLDLAAIPAIQWHRAIGASRKAARLRYLSRVIRARLRAAVPDARFYAGDAPEMTCGLTTVEIAGVDPEALQKRLRQRHGVLVQDMTDPVHAPKIRGVRISPNVYATPAEIDRFARAFATEVSQLRGDKS